jgi:hypothetical protein
MGLGTKLSLVVVEGERLLKCAEATGDRGTAMSVV